MAHACPYCRVATPDDEPLCPRCGAPQPVPSPQPTAGAWGRWVDPLEGAFAVALPQDWLAQGGTYRTPPYGLPEGRFEARGDRDGHTRVRIGGQSWQFMDVAPPGAAMGGWLGGMMQAFTGMGTPHNGLSWRDAGAFAESWLLPAIRQAVPNATMQQMTRRPDVEATARQTLQMDAVARGLAGYEAECTVAEILMSYREHGTPYLERLRIQTGRLRAAAMGWTMGMTPPAMWFAEVSFAYRAPSDDFARAEPTLRTIAESLQRNPAWQAAQVNADNARAFASQQQNAARLRQIGQTLSDTSDIVSSGYWSRQDIHQQHEAGRQAMNQPGSDWAQNWSDAMLGWEERVDDLGNRYSVEAGHTRMWRDNQGHVITGNELTTPDPTWHELKKPGT